MKARVANMLICRQFDKWVESIEDAKVKDLVKAKSDATGSIDQTYLMELIDRIV